MTPEIQNVLTVLLVAILGGAATKGVPALWNWVDSYFKTLSTRALNDATNENRQDALDNETRELTNRLALQAFDIQARLHRLQAEYEAQGELVKTQASEIVRLSRELENERLAKGEYQEQVQQLVKELTASVARIMQLENEIKILETMINTPYTDKDG